ncbi:unnamed protein product [Pleuronectes platessa]|uniref:Uncharacterized protein n=1 Tax=Pleuronectes platessa TaxID=8262 RepID=A0A9N7VE50_PLEPL|nr:unnamed protein product [Pleuronectes platessa]
MGPALAHSHCLTPSLSSLSILFHPLVRMAVQNNAAQADEGGGPMTGLVPKFLCSLKKRVGNTIAGPAPLSPCQPQCSQLPGRVNAAAGDSAHRLANANLIVKQSCQDPPRGHRMAAVKGTCSDLHTYQAGLERGTRAETGSDPLCCHSLTLPLLPTDILNTSSSN